jgi:hypothetical protein
LLLFKKNVLSKNVSKVTSKSLPLFFFNFQDISKTLSNSGFNDPATSVMEGMLNLHHDIMFVCILILTFVG